MGKARNLGNGGDKMNDFWNKVVKCEHKRLSPNYLEYIPCDTPYCTGYESHCLDCGIYISECGCGSNAGLSGWPYKRCLSQRLRREFPKGVAIIGGER